MIFVHPLLYPENINDRRKKAFRISGSYSNTRKGAVSVIERYSITRTDQ
jgi:hypothetical protein